MKRKEHVYPENENLPGLEPGCPIGHLGFEDLRPGPKEILQRAIESRIPFDTGWHGTDKGFAYMRVQSNGKSMKLSVSQEMDDWPEVVTDCPGGETLTEDEIDRLEILADLMGFTTSTSISVEIGWEPFERVMVRLNSMARSTDALLERNFDMLRQLVKEVVQSKEEKNHERI